MFLRAFASVAAPSAATSARRGATTSLLSVSSSSSLSSSAAVACTTVLSPVWPTPMPLWHARSLSATSTSTAAAAASTAASTAAALAAHPNAPLMARIHTLATPQRNDATGRWHKAKLSRRQYKTLRRIAHERALPWVDAPAFTRALNDDGSPALPARRTPKLHKHLRPTTIARRQRQIEDALKEMPMLVAESKLARQEARAERKGIKQLIPHFITNKDFTLKKWKGARDKISFP